MQNFSNATATPVHREYALTPAPGLDATLLGAQIETWAGKQQDAGTQFSSVAEKGGRLVLHCTAEMAEAAQSQFAAQLARPTPGTAQRSVQKLSA